VFPPLRDALAHSPNRSPGKPRFVTALIYLNEHWEGVWGASTQFLDPPTERVLAINPKPGRVVVMVRCWNRNSACDSDSQHSIGSFRPLLQDQDITHAVTAPSPEAGGRPRYSLACKLVLHPAEDGNSDCVIQLVHPKHGPPSLFGSAQDGPVREET
jgi:hypothetical protein